VALDVPSAADAQKIVGALGDYARFYKVGMQLYTAEGPAVVRELIRAGKQVFLDLKYHDIPNSVAAAVGEAARLGVSMLTVHASGGTKMLEAAASAAITAAAATTVVSFIKAPSPGGQFVSPCGNTVVLPRKRSS